MCGRFTLTAGPDELARQFMLPLVPDLPPRYNITPGGPIYAVRVTREGRHHFDPLRWGLIPSWSKDPAIGQKLTNARAETVHEKPSFRTSFSQRRCLVPATGYYEWKKGEDGKKVPHYFQMKGGGVFALAGLWDRWEGPEGEVLETCCLLTMPPNELAATVHDRMPVILDFSDHDMWLDPEYHNPMFLRGMMRPWPAAEMEMWPVGPRVNNPRADGPELIAPLGVA